MAVKERIARPRLEPGAFWPWFRGWTIWGDRWAWGIATAAVVVNLGLFAYVYLSYSTLPPLIPLHYSSSNAVDLIGEPEQLFKLPAIGGIVLVVDFLLSAAAHRTERFAALMLLGGSLFVQALLLAATVNIVRLA